MTGSLHFLQERARYQSYDSERFYGQSGGIAVGERHLLGIGPGQFEGVVKLSAHSTYVRALAEEGVLGFMVLVGLFLGTLWLAHPQCRQGLGHVRPQLDRAARRLVRHPREQRLRGHPALAAPLAGRRADLGSAVRRRRTRARGCER